MPNYDTAKFTDLEIEETLAKPGSRSEAYLAALHAERNTRSDLPTGPDGGRREQQPSGQQGATSAAGSGDATPSGAAPTSSAATAPARDPFADDVLERLARSNVEYQREHGHYIVPLAERLLAARIEIERLREQVNSGRLGRERAEGLPEGTLPRV